MANCIRCGKPCNDGETMCSECNAWFQAKTGGSSIPGVQKRKESSNKLINGRTSKKKKHMQPVQNITEMSGKTDSVDARTGMNAYSAKDSTQKDYGANKVSFKNIVNSFKTRGIIIAGVVAVVVVAAMVTMNILKKSSGDNFENTVAYSEKDYEQEAKTDAEIGAEDETDEVENDDLEETEEESKSTVEESEKTSTYEYVVKDVSWQQAEIEAEEAGGHLAIITDEEEYYKVCEVADESGLTYIWLGARIDSTSDDWNEWIDGEEWTYDNWYPDEPSKVDANDNVDELYLCMWNAKYNGNEIGWTFNDQRNDMVADFSSVSGRIGYIIEFEE